MGEYGRRQESGDGEGVGETRIMNHMSEKRGGMAFRALRGPRLGWHGKEEAVEAATEPAAPHGASETEQCRGWCGGVAAWEDGRDAAAALRTPLFTRLNDSTLYPAHSLPRPSSSTLAFLSSSPTPDPSFSISLQRFSRPSPCPSPSRSLSSVPPH
ncbi:hypothetical protein E2C01_084506 [Portunus trituberculatus]|uniref:Uncharacterized protein n=1 Tax=Portunus trituberculatus TaxID=210409 RepID=A0A5B7J507_PORTR|nr:hypothetical protein [Portunus trituberculatus]